MNRIQKTGVLASLSIILAAVLLSAFSSTGANGQAVSPYPHARTDRRIQPESWLALPPVNSVVVDPDFGEQIVRVTDENTDPSLPGATFQTSDIGQQNTWSADSRKFIVVREGGAVLPFSFNPSTMAVARLLDPNTHLPFSLHFTEGPTFSYRDPDLIYGTSDGDFLTIKSYRFSTGQLSTVLDTRTCGVQPPLNPDATNGVDLTASADDSRLAMSEGGTEVNKHMFVVLEDRELGCRWYNTQTGQIGGQWGAVGYTPAAGYNIHHVYLTKGGRYVRVQSEYTNYFWDVQTLNVTACSFDCDGYEGQGYSHFVHAPGLIDDMNIWERPIDNLNSYVQLVVPLKTPHGWALQQHYSWNNANPEDNVPVCLSTYGYAYGPIQEPWDGEILCIETDGVRSTVWRFAHTRTVVGSDYLSQPLGNVSPDGRFFEFDSNWDRTVGFTPEGLSRYDVWIVALR
jgi:hypothetical protein